MGWFNHQLGHKANDLSQRDPEARDQSLLIRGVSKEMLFVVAASVSETRGESFMAVSNNLSTRVRWFSSLKSRVQDVGVSLNSCCCCPKFKKSQELSVIVLNDKETSHENSTGRMVLVKSLILGEALASCGCSASFFGFHAGVVTISTVGTGTGIQEHEIPKWILS